MSTLADGLVCRADLDEGTLSTVADVVGAPDNGNFVGTWQSSGNPADNGPYIQISSEAAYAEFPDQSRYSPTTGLTILIAHKDTSVSGNGWLVSKDNEYQVYKNVSTLNFYVWDNTTGAYMEADATGAFSGDTNWHVIVCRMSGINSSDLQILRGTPGGSWSDITTARSSSGTFTQIRNTGSKLAIGNNEAHGDADYLNGFSRGRIWNRAITDSGVDIMVADLDDFTTAESGAGPSISSVTPDSAIPNPDVDVILEGVEIAGTSLDAPLTSGQRVTFSDTDVAVEGTPTVTGTLITLDVRIAAGAAPDIGTVQVETDDGTDTAPFTVADGTGGTNVPSVDMRGGFVN